MRTLSTRMLGPVIAIVALGGFGGTAIAQFATGYSYQSGADIYTHVCQGCHMPDGKGAVGAGAYPPLAANRKLAAGMYPVLVMLKGQKAMPSFADLTDAQVAAVTTYIRTNLGNAYPDAITADQVKTLRAQAIRQTMRAPG